MSDLTPPRPDFLLAVTVYQLARDYVAGRALDGVEANVEHVWSLMYESLEPLDAAEREVKIAQVERLMHAPTAH